MNLISNPAFVGKWLEVRVASSVCPQRTRYGLTARKCSPFHAPVGGAHRDRPMSAFPRSDQLYEAGHQPTGRLPAGTRAATAPLLLIPRPDLRAQRLRSTVLARLRHRQATRSSGQADRQAASSRVSFSIASAHRAVRGLRSVSPRNAGGQCAVPDGRRHAWAYRQAMPSGRYRSVIAAGVVLFDPACVWTLTQDVWLCRDYLFGSLNR